MATKRQLVNCMKMLNNLPPYEDTPKERKEVLEKSLVRDLNYSKYSWTEIEVIAYEEAGR